MQEYVDAAAMSPFERSREVFESLIGGLAGPDADTWTHAELEERLGQQGRELLRVIEQDRLDLSAARERRRENVTDADGVRHTRVECGHHRPLTSIFGTVTCKRMAYRALGAGNLYPGDAVANLPVERHSHGLRRLCAVESARGSFEQAAAAIERATGVRLGKRQIEALTRAAAADISDYYAQLVSPPRCEQWALALSVDGKGIVMLPGALRELTARAAQTTSRHLASRLSPGEKLGRKRMGEVGAVYDFLPVPRTAEQIMTRGGVPAAAGPAAEAKWLTASVVDSAAAVITEVFDEASRRDPEHRRAWVVLVDGNRHQIDRANTEAAARGAEVTIVVDFVHVLEYLWKAAWTFFYTGDPEAEAWVADKARKVLQGKAGQVATGIRRRATAGGFNTRERKNADICADYLTAKAPYLDYPTALANGWPIATGIIEGACRHIVKDRMDITGARWGLAGAEAILKLRTLIANGDFPAYWTYHLRKEHERVHQTRYLTQDKLTLAA